MNLLIASVMALYASLIEADKVIMTTSGLVQGITVESEEILLEAYLGVPYAEPPVGRLRFAKPIPKTHWKGVYDASRLPPPCIQNVTEPKFYLPDITYMSEDCLYLNVWTPYSQLDSKLKAVLFFIHGGGFNFGSSNMTAYNGAKLASRGDVVVVTINYRVGAMGFFCALTDDAGGNMGLRDQILALEWIRTNAVSFHGDPDKIVVIGESAGAMSASALAMSPVSKHMVKRVIIQSGSLMMPMVLGSNDRLYEISQRLAQLVGCTNEKVTLENNSRKIIKCLKSIPPIEISRAEGILMALSPVTFIPRMEDDVLPMNTIEMIRNGELKDVEMLIGVTKNEGSFFLTLTAPQYFGEYGLDTGNINKHLACQIIRMVSKLIGLTNSKDVCDFYVNNIKNGTPEKYIDTISQFFGDVTITCSSIFQAEFHSVKNNVYFYKFSHRTAASPFAEWMGVLHAEELQYIFEYNAFGNFTEEEQILSNKMMDRWTSFAKTG